MEPIYVTGHRNPDTDSIVAAISYAALRNACGEREYVPVRLGPVPQATQAVLDRFCFPAPKLLTNLHTQVRDLDFDKPPVLSTAVTVGRAWDVLQAHMAIAALPVAHEDGTLCGVLSRVDIASYNMTLTDSGVLDPVPLFNVLSILEGTLLNAAQDHTDTISGEVVIALPKEDNVLPKADSIVFCGNQPELIRQALENNVRCLVLCQATLPGAFLDIPTQTCIIATPFDAFRAARRIFLSVPIGQICKTTGLISFHLDDRADDVKESVLKHRHPSYPILDAQEKVVGVLTRYHLLRPRRKRVVLVDHNEIAQSVPGLEEAEVLEIIDHHRLADIQTKNPIFVRNEPVGSTNTIIADLFREQGLMPSAGIAGLMAAAILSDTVMFKSPTCTPRDVQTAQRMARIAQVSPEELGKQIFSSDLEGRSARDLLFSDYKEFRISGNSMGVGQITCIDTDSMLARKDEFLELMASVAKEKHLDLMILMLTDVLREGTQLIYLGEDQIIQDAFGIPPKDNAVFLPGMMSRKKQIIPLLSDLWG